MIAHPFGGPLLVETPICFASHLSPCPGTWSESGQQTSTGAILTVGLLVSWTKKWMQFKWVSVWSFLWISLQRLCCFLCVILGLVLALHHANSTHISWLSKQKNMNLTDLSYFTTLNEVVILGKSRAVSYGRVWKRAPIGIFVGESWLSNRLSNRFRGTPLSGNAPPQNKKKN